MQIQEAPHGINLVVETADKVYIGRFDQTDGFQVLMHDCAIHTKSAGDAGEDTGAAEEFIKNTAKYGVAVEERDIVFEASGIQRVRILGDIPKE